MPAWLIFSAQGNMFRHLGRFQNKSGVTVSGFIIDPFALIINSSLPDSTVLHSCSVDHRLERGNAGATPVWHSPCRRYSRKALQVF